MSQLIANETLSQMDVDALLEVDVNNIEEVAEFVPMPTGMYRFTVGTPSIEEVGKNNSKAIKVPFTLTECVEVGNPDNEEDVEIVATTFAEGGTVVQNENFFLESSNSSKTAYGVRSFVTIFKQLLEAGQTANVSQLIEYAAGSSGEALIEKSSYKKEGSDEVLYSSRINANNVVFD